MAILTLPARAAAAAFLAALGATVYTDVTVTGVWAELLRDQTEEDPPYVT
jgi:hypothetical protein